MPETLFIPRWSPALLALAFVFIVASSLLPTSAFSSTMSKSSRLDVNMEQTYDDLARRAIEAYKSNQGSGRDNALWIACVGGPGAGKTTLAKAVAGRIRDIISSSSSSIDDIAVAIPMDGYHYTKDELAQLAQTDDNSKGMNRRGAPWTFNAPTLASDLAEAKRNGKGSLSEYDREISDPVPNAIEVDEHHQIFLVEGNYLLLGCLEAELDKDGKTPKSETNLYETVLGTECPWEGTRKGLDCPVPIGDEIRRWKGIQSLFDETWFVAPPGGVEEQRRRLIERSLKTWTPEKTEAWGGGTDREAAMRRADFNDVRNAWLVDCCRQYADVVVASV
mmetsp:Transcript_29604/g.65202  ORF Transcript_29604/g.65202 Transcript_29604/m.65202 type:complete len:334 (-) Transcript_29604:55-1056(-)